jgi:hypothetical protein
MIPSAQTRWNICCRHDGGWSSGADLGGSDWNTGLALFAIAKLSDELSSRKKLSDDLQARCTKIYKDSLTHLTSMRTDHISDLSRTVMTAVAGADFDYPRGWPWEEKTWHWVEPTSYALLALKARRFADEKLFNNAIEQAEKYLYERSCKNGGWNWGQVTTFGMVLPAIPRDTAITLLALQDKPSHEVVTKALNVLRTGTGVAAGGVDTAHPLTLLARNVLGEDVVAQVDQYTKNYKPPEYGGENLVALACAIMAAELPEKGNAFKLNSAQKVGS